MRVTHCPVNTAGIPWTNVQALRTRGIEAQLVVTRVADESPVDGLTLSIQPWMPAMNHGAIAPTVVAQGDGKYLVTELDLFMPGHWQLRTAFSGPMTDHVTPAFDIQ